MKHFAIFQKKARHKYTPCFHPRRTNVVVFSYNARSVRRYRRPNLTLAPFAVINFKRATVTGIASINNACVFLVGGFLRFCVSHVNYSFVVDAFIIYDQSSLSRTFLKYFRYDEKTRKKAARRRLVVFSQRCSKSEGFCVGNHVSDCACSVVFRQNSPAYFLQVAAFAKRLQSPFNCPA